MVVCADQFFNETVQHADIVLPVTTAFEEWNVDASYWHYWLSINQPAIKPMYEAKCDLEIATMLSRTINKMAPGSCTFPQEFDHKRWLDQEFNDGMAKMFGISSWDDLLDGPKKRFCQVQPPGTTASSKRRQASMNLNLNWRRKTAIPRCRNTNRKPSKLPFHLFTPHVQFGLHSQFINLDWMQVFYPEPFVYIHPSSAQKKASARTIWSKFSMAPVKLSCGQKSPPTCRKIFW